MPTITAVPEQVSTPQTSPQIVPRILGALLYYSPTDPAIYTLLTQLSSLPDLYHWSDKAQITALCQQITLPELDELVYQHSVLFEGQGKMTAPPWGAVYQDKDNLLMSDSTIRYRQFLSHNQLFFTSTINEPEDQFGLMLLALTSLLEQGKLAAAHELLSQHLLPWGYRYLQLLADNTISPVYSTLGKITHLFLQELQAEYQLQPAEQKLYF